MIGFVDITNPRSPRPLGTVDVGGEPTSVAVHGGYAYAGVNTSPDYVNPSGKLVQIRISSRAVTREVDLGGQPDAVAISPDGQYLAVAIENERDEDLGDGEPPQMPAGYVQIVEMATMTATTRWSSPALPASSMAPTPSPSSSRSTRTTSWSSHCRKTTGL